MSRAPAAVGPKRRAISKTAPPIVTGIEFSLWNVLWGRLDARCHPSAPRSRLRGGRPRLEEPGARWPRDRPGEVVCTRRRSSPLGRRGSQLELEAESIHVKRQADPLHAGIMTAHDRSSAVEFGSAGIDLDVKVLRPRAMFKRMLDNAEFEVSELFAGELRGSEGARRRPLRRNSLRSERQTGWRYVAPDFVRADLTQRGRGAADWPGTEERFAAMGRIGEPEDIANAVWRRERGRSSPGLTMKASRKAGCGKSASPV